MNVGTIYLSDLPKCRCFTLLRWSSSLRKGKGSMQLQISLTARGFNKVILHVVPWTNISPLCYLEMFFIPSYSMNPVFPHHLLVRKLIKRTFLSIFITATFLGAIGKAAAWWHFGVWFKKMFVNSIPAKRKHFSGIIISFGRHIGIEIEAQLAWFQVSSSDSARVVCHHESGV